MGHMVGKAEEVGSSFTGRVGAAGMEGGEFGEATLFYGAIDFIGGHLDKLADAVLSGTFEENLSADDVGFKERRGIKYAAVNMRLSGKVYHCIKFPTEQLINQLPVGNIAFDESVIGVLLDILKVFQVAGVGEFIQVGYLPVRVLLYYMANEVAANKTRAAGDQ